MRGSSDVMTAIDVLWITSHHALAARVEQCSIGIRRVNHATPLSVARPIVRPRAKQHFSASTSRTTSWPNPSTPRPSSPRSPPSSRTRAAPTSPPSGCSTRIRGCPKGVTGGASFSSWNRRRAAGRAQDLGAFYGGIHRGSDITLVADAHTTRDMREHGLPHGPDEAIRVLNAQAAWTKQPDAVGSVTTTAEAFA